MTTKKLVAFNTLAQVLGKVATVSSTLIITFLLTNRLGQVSYGEFTIIMAYAALFYLAVDFGINAVFTQRVTADESKIKAYFFNLLSLRIVLSLVVMFLALSFLAFTPYSANIKLGILVSSLTILTQGLFNTANALFQFKLRYQYATIADVTASLLNVLIVYYLASYQASITWIVVSYVLAGVLRVIVSFFLTRRLIGPLSLEIDLNLWKHLFLAALPLGLTAILSQINGNADKVILSLVDFDPALGVGNVVAVGWYGLAYKIFEVLLVLPTFVMNSAYPLMVKSVHEDQKRLKSIFIFLLGSLGSLSVAVSLIGFFLAPLIIALFQSDASSFEGSILVLRVLLLGLPIFYISALTLWTTIALGQQRILMYVYGLAAFANVVLNLIFDPQYGILAAAVITLATEILVIIPTAWISYRALFARSER